MESSCTTYSCRLWVGDVLGQRIVHHFRTKITVGVRMSLGIQEMAAICTYSVKTDMRPAALLVHILA